jgi:hypothetical protein
MKPYLVDFTLNKSKPWVLAFLYGQRTKNGSADTLKKLFATPSEKTRSREGFIQILPLRVAVSPAHVEWVGFGLIQSLESNSLHFRQPSLEFIARAAGTFQWEDVLQKVSLTPSDEHVVLVWMGPRNEWNEKYFLRTAEEWGLKHVSVWPAVSETNEIFALERSALVGLE